MDNRLLDILVCPLCKGKLVLDKPAAELICRADHLAYPIRDGIPVMLIDEARQLNPDANVVTANKDASPDNRASASSTSSSE